ARGHRRRGARPPRADRAGSRGRARQSSRRGGDGVRRNRAPRDRRDRPNRRQRELRFRRAASRFLQAEFPSPLAGEGGAKRRMRGRAVTLVTRRRPLVGGSQRWRYKGSLQAFFQTSPKVACFAPSFSKEIFGGFVGFQRVTRLPNVLRWFPNFSPSAAPFRPHFGLRRTAFRRLAWSVRRSA